MKDLLGKRAVVTGASRGIGAAIANALAARGADVMITYQSSSEKALEVVSEIEAKGQRGFAVKADAADATSIQNFINEAVEKLGGIDLLVNNAGVLFGSTLEEQNIDDIDKMIDINVRGVILTTKAALPHIANGGRIISIGSCLAERVAFEQAVVYSATKSALLAFTRGLAREVGSREITVNLVHPGPTDTDMNPASGPYAESMRAHIALGHYGKPDDIAEAVGFLASPSARHITGTGLSVDGGTNA